MDRLFVEQFCMRWIEKSNACGENWDSIFDRFFSLYVAFNRLYSAVATEQSSRGNQFGWRFDREQATVGMQHFIGAQRFRECMDRDEQIKDACVQIAELLRNRAFFLHHNRTGQPDLSRDARLADGLVQQSLQSVLQALYQIRCNIFHGEKELAQRQMPLMEPATFLLSTILFCAVAALRDNY